MADSSHTGGCLCGAVRYEAKGDVLFSALCHCTMCRLAAGAPMVAWAMFREEEVRFTGTPTWYASSPGAKRAFCPRCGTSLAFTGDSIPGLIDLTTATFDEPARVRPQFHYWDSVRIPWVIPGDGLHRYPEFPPAPE